MHDEDEGFLRERFLSSPKFSNNYVPGFYFYKNKALRGHQEEEGSREISDISRFLPCVLLCVRRSLHSPTTPHTWIPTA